MNYVSAFSPEEKYSRDLIAMRYWLLGKEYHTALSAMEFARSFHTGVRKDGITPEFAHQLFMARYVRTLLPGIIHGEETLACIMLHDVCEDYDVGFEEIERRFGKRIERPVKLLTKKYRGTVIPYDTYFHNISEDPVASIGKGVDRTHNLFTMSDANWTVEKQSNYLDEGDTRFLPMLKTARRMFPSQEPVYENIKTMMLMQMKLIRMNLNMQAQADYAETGAAPQI